jgi:hypothetical protein
MGEQVTYVELPRCGHIPMDEDPERFLSIVQPFLEKVLRERNESKRDVLKEVLPVITPFLQKRDDFDQTNTQEVAARESDQLGVQ